MPLEVTLHRATGFGHLMRLPGHAGFSAQRGALLVTVVSTRWNSQEGVGLAI